MDHRIYGRLSRSDLGVYGTRRFPKGQALKLEPPSGPTSPLDPSNNPLPINLIYRASGVGAHADVQRWSYTVPPLRRAVMQSAITEFSVSATAANGFMVSALIALRRKGSTSDDVHVCRVTSHENGQFSNSLRQTTGTPVELFEGDTLRGVTTQFNGTYAYVVDAVIIEYDAEHKALQGYALGGSFNNIGYPTVGGSGVLQQQQSSGGYKTIIRVEGGSGPFYVATGWTDLGGGYYGK